MRCIRKDKVKQVARFRKCIEATCVVTYCWLRVLRGGLVVLHPGSRTFLRLGRPAPNHRPLMCRISPAESTAKSPLD